MFGLFLWFGFILVSVDYNLGLRCVIALGWFWVVCVVLRVLGIVVFVLFCGDWCVWIRYNIASDIACFMIALVGFGV